MKTFFLGIHFDACTLTSVEIERSICHLFPIGIQNRLVEILDFCSKKHSYYGQLLIRNLCARIGVAHELKYSNFGKPYLINHRGKPQENIYWNIAHDNSLAVLLYSDDSKCVGIDCMGIRIPSNDDNLSESKFMSEMQSAFTDMEWKFIDGSLKNFYVIWCLKEAYVKAIGIGLEMELSRLSFIVDGNKILGYLDGLSLDNWEFCVIFDVVNYVIATARLSPSLEIPNLEIVNLQDLLEK